MIQKFSLISKGKSKQIKNRRLLSHEVSPNLSALSAIERAGLLKRPEALSLLEDYDLKYSSQGTQLLKSLKRAKCIDLPELKVLELDEVDTSLQQPESQFFFVRSFYPHLFNSVLPHHRSILIGNPGIGPSTFPMYVRWLLLLVILLFFKLFFRY